ncbi:MAG: OmpH family outer membrane protein [Syntrophobacteraceae bacterium]|nr:OmpH family outer membrane protein [Syntrophobacteraceae bacterium]
MAWLAFFMVFVLAGASAAAASPKIGYFDLQTILDQSKAGQTAKEDFKREKERLKVEMEEKGRQLKSAKDDLDKKKSAMDESAKNKKMAELQMEAEKYAMESQGKLNKLSNDLMSPIVDKTLEIVRTMGKSEKYDYIFEVGKGGIVWATEKDDLTKKVLQELDRSPIPSKK